MNRVHTTCWILMLGLAACEGDGISKLQPRIEVSPESVLFDSVPLQTRTRRTISVANRGSGPLNVEGMSADVPFGIEGQIDALRPSERAELTVWFDAGDIGTGEGRLLIQSNDPERGALTVPLLATRRPGPILTVCHGSRELGVEQTCAEETRIDFGSFRVGERRRYEVTLRNDGDDVLEVEGITIDASPFEMGPTPDTATLAPGESLALTLSLTPNEERAYGGELLIRSNDQAQPTRSIPLTGAGAASPLCLEPTSIDFGIIPLGQTATKRISLTNCGDGAVTVEGASITGAPFSIPETTAVTLSPGGGVSWGLDVTFHPEGEGRSSGRLRIQTDRGSAWVDVVGGAARCVVRVPDRVELVSRLGETAEQMITIENPGSEACTIHSMTLSALPRQFELEAPAFPRTLDSGGRVEVTVRYRPLDLVRDETSIHVTADSEVQPELLIPLIGEPLESEIPCEASASPSPLHFGVPRPGEQRTSSVVLFAFPGHCAITELTLASAHPDLELLRPDLQLPHLMEPDEMLVLPIRYRASEAGEVSAVLRIGVNSTFPVVQVPIGGSSQAGQICVSPASLSGPGDITIEACGDQSIEVSARLETPDASLGLSGLQSVTRLLPGETATVQVSHDGSATDNAVQIDSDDGRRPRIRVPVRAGPKTVDVAGSLLFDRANSTDFSAVIQYGFRGSEQPVLYPSEQTSNCFGCHASSPDGRFVISQSSRAPDMLGAVDRETGDELPLGHRADDSINLAFNPDPLTDPPYQYVFGEGGDLHLGSLSAGYLGPLLGASEPDVIEGFPTWSNDGRIAFVRGAQATYNPFQMWGQLEILVVEAAGGAATLVVSSTRSAAYYPDFSPDGRYLAFTESVAVLATETSFAASDAQIRLVEIATGQQHQLPAANGADGASGMARFSKDGRHLGFHSDRSGGAGGYDLYVAPIELDTGLDQPAIPLSDVNTELSEHLPAWSN